MPDIEIRFDMGPADPRDPPARIQLMVTCPKCERVITKTLCLLRSAVTAPGRSMLS